MRSLRNDASWSRLRLTTGEDGTCTARVPGGRNSSPPRFDGRFEAADGAVVLEGVIRESHANVGIPRGFCAIAAFCAAVAVSLVINGKAAPGAYVCGVSALVLGLLGYVMARLRRPAFDGDCRQLMKQLLLLMPGARPTDEDADGGRRRYLP